MPLRKYLRHETHPRRRNRRSTRVHRRFHHRQAISRLQDCSADSRELSRSFNSESHFRWLRLRRADPGRDASDLNYQITKQTAAESIKVVGSFSDFQIVLRSGTSDTFYCRLPEHSNFRTCILPAQTKIRQLVAVVDF